MKRRFIAVILAAALIAGLFTGCGGSEKTESEAAQTGGTSPENTSAPSLAEQAIQDRLDHGKVTVNFTFFNITGEPSGTGRVEAAINKITEPELGITVDIQIIDMGSYSQNMTLMLASGEQVDVFNTYSCGFTSMINKGNLLNMYEDDLIYNYGQDILEMWSEESLMGCTIDGCLYGLPVKKDDATALWEYCVPAEYLDEIGIDYKSMYENDSDETIDVDMAFIEDMLAKLHEAYPEKTTLYIGQGLSAGQTLVMDSVGGDTFGVLCDPVNSLEVTNLFESDMYYEMCERNHNWNKLGYISKDAAVDSTSQATYIAAGTLCCYQAAGKPGFRNQESTNCQKDMVVFQVGEDFKKSSCYSLMPWAINSMTEDKVAAMQLLNAFATDPRLSNLLIWGEEGVDYKITEDGHAAFADGVDISNAEYFNGVGWEMPNQFIAEVWQGNDLNIWKATEEFNNLALASKAIGFSWDNSDYATVYSALKNVYSEYSNEIELGFRDPAEAIPEFVAALKAAGLEKYMAAKQEALNEWADSNGIAR